MIIQSTFVGNMDDMIKIMIEKYVFPELAWIQAIIVVYGINFVMKVYILLGRQPPLQTSLLDLHLQKGTC